MGFDTAAIRRAINLGLFESGAGGVLQTIRPSLRAGKLVKAGITEQDTANLEPGAKVQRVVNGKVVDLVVVGPNGSGGYTVGDPTKPDAPNETVKADEISPVAPLNGGESPSAATSTQTDHSQEPPDDKHIPFA